jgi:hypothetical protein
MASHSQDNPHTLSTLEMSNSPQHEEENLFLDIPYAHPHEELNQFRRITRDYTQNINSFPLAPLLPRRKKIRIPMVKSPDQVFVHRVKDLICFSLNEIEHPLNLIPETPADKFSKPVDFSEEEVFNSGSEDMEDNNDHDEESGNPPQNNQPCLARDVFSIHGRVHNFPRHPETLLPKFDPETLGFLDDHIKKFILSIKLMNVQHEDVVCRLFPYIFDNSASMWYFNLPVGSIASWTKFQKDFLDKFGEETTTRDLMAKLFTATMS